MTGALSIMKCFMSNVLQENLTYNPGYAADNQLGMEQNIMSIRLRIEGEGYESAKFKSLLGNQNCAPQGSEDRIDYIMMRRYKLNEV